MFEQSYYSQIPAEPVREGDFLYDYEVRSWELSPRIYRILGASVIANILIIAIFGQTSFMTAKGCDSPLVGRVCQVLDTVYVGAMLFGTDRDYVDVAYQKTDLSDADITFIDVSGAEPPLEYPPGYFQLANPERQYTNPDLPSFNSGYIAPGIPSNPTATTPNLVNTPQVLPNANPNVIEGGKLPTFDNPTMPGVKVRRGGRIKSMPANTSVASNDANANSNANTTTNPTVVPTGPTNPDEINSRPFKDLAIEVNDLLANKKVDLQAPIQIAAHAKLDKDGKIAKGSFKVTKAVSSDPQLVKVVTDAVAAFNDSNLLNYLKQLEGKDLSFSVQQDQTSISAAIQSEMERETRAQSMVGIIKLGIDLAVKKKQDKIAQMEVENNPAEATNLQNARDDLELLKSTMVSAQGKTFMVSFAVQKDILHQMIQRKLQEQAAQTKKEIGSTSPTPNENANIR